MDLSSVPSWKKALESASCQMYFIPRDSYELEEKSLTVILYFKITRLSFALTTGVTYFLWGHSFWTYLEIRIIPSFFLSLKKTLLTACIIKTISYKQACSKGQKSGGGGHIVLGGDNVPPPAWDRVNWSAKKWGARVPPAPPLVACLIKDWVFGSGNICSVINLESAGSVSTLNPPLKILETIYNNENWWFSSLSKT